MSIFGDAFCWGEDCFIFAFGLSFGGGWDSVDGSPSEGGGLGSFFGESVPISFNLFLIACALASTFAHSSLSSTTLLLNSAPVDIVDCLLLLSRGSSPADMSEGFDDTEALFTLDDLDDSPVDICDDLRPLSRLFPMPDKSDRLLDTDALLMLDDLDDFESFDENDDALRIVEGLSVAFVVDCCPSFLFLIA